MSIAVLEGYSGFGFRLSVNVRVFIGEWEFRDQLVTDEFAGHYPGCLA